MSDLKPALEKLHGAENKFWKICNYLTMLLYPHEKLINWCVGINQYDSYTTNKSMHANAEIASFLSMTGILVQCPSTYTSFLVSKCDSLTMFNIYGKDYCRFSSAFIEIAFN